MSNQENVQTNNETSNFPVKLVLLLSKTCGFCVELLKRNIENLLALNAYLLYKEDRPVEFNTYMTKTKAIINLQYPELKQHDSITPVLLIINANDDSILNVVLGFTSIESLVSQLSNNSNNKV